MDRSLRSTSLEYTASEELGLGPYSCAAEEEAGTRERTLKHLNTFSLINTPLRKQSEQDKATRHKTCGYPTDRPQGSHMFNGCVRFRDQENK